MRRNFGLNDAPESWLASVAMSIYVRCTGGIQKLFETPENLPGENELSEAFADRLNFVLEKYAIGNPCAVVLTNENANSTAVALRSDVEGVLRDFMVLDRVLVRVHLSVSRAMAIVEIFPTSALFDFLNENSTKH